MNNLSPHDWIIVIFENDTDNDIWYTKGPFNDLALAQSWAKRSEDCQDGNFQIVTLRNPT